MASNRDELAASWSREEFGTIDLGDKRLTERLIRVADELESQPQSSINAACGDWTSTKAAYRLFNNEKVTAQKILAAHFQQTVARMENHSRVFAIQDTTFLDYTHHPLTEGLPNRNKEAEHLWVCQTHHRSVHRVRGAIRVSNRQSLGA